MFVDSHFVVLIAFYRTLYESKGLEFNDVCCFSTPLTQGEHVV
jgi:hypothetical protein